MQELIQRTLDAYGAGVAISQVQLLRVDPPTDVVAAFRDVQAAQADQVRVQNEAQTYANKVVPEAHGEASRITNAAVAYRDRLIAEAKGQADRFSKVYDSYKAAPEVTRRRMYLETMEDVLGDTDKIILDNKVSGSGVLPYLPLDSLGRGARPSSSSGWLARCRCGGHRWIGRQPMRRGIFGGLGLVIVVAIGIALYLSVFIVDQTQQALVLRFGEAVRKIDAPGLYYKLPLIDTVVDLDKRILDLESPPLEIIASDQKRLVVDAFGRYRIADPLLFFQAVGTIPGAELRLSVVLQASVRRVLGDAEFIDVVRNRRAVLMGQIREQVEREALTFGVKVVDVKIRHADLPPSNSQAIIQRMQTERQRQATEISRDRRAGLPAHQGRGRPRRDRHQGRTRPANRNACAARARRRRTVFSPRPSEGIPTSSPSIARCRPM